MKRTLILLLASGMLLAGCNCPFAEQPVQEDEIAELAGPKAQSEHVTYLVLSKVGRYSGGDVVAKDDTLFLENFIKFTGAGGTALPGKDVISATSGAEFVSWVAYEGTGALTEYTEVPMQSGKILYAYFKGTGSTPTPGPGPSPEPGETVTYTITGMPNWVGNDGACIFAWSWGGSEADAWTQVVLGPQGNGGADAKELSGTITIPAGRTGFNLARCVAGTTQPNWTAKGDSEGRVYNKTGDVTITAGQTSYASPNWVEYNP